MPDYMEMILQALFGGGGLLMIAKVWADYRRNNKAAKSEESKGYTGNLRDDVAQLKKQVAELQQAWAKAVQDLADEKSHHAETRAERDAAIAKTQEFERKHEHNKQRIDRMENTLRDLIRLMAENEVSVPAELMLQT